MSAQATTSTHGLDALLEHYLALLDEHERLREEARRHLRAGHLSLAEANFKSPNRTRYGPDLYTEKMQATLVVDVLGDSHDANSDSDPNSKIPAHDHGSRLEGGDQAAAAAAATGQKDDRGGQGSKPPPPPPPSLLPWRMTARQLPTGIPKPKPGQRRRKAGRKQDEDDLLLSGEHKPEARGPAAAVSDPSVVPPPPPPPPSLSLSSSLPTPPPSSRNATPADVDDDDDDDGGDARPAFLPLPPDPIRQFGILVPPALRAAQASFRSAAAGCLVRVAQLDAQMKALELEIRRARKKKGRARKGSVAAAAVVVVDSSLGTVE